MLYCRQNKEATTWKGMDYAWTVWFSLCFPYLLNFWGFRWMSRSLSAVLWLLSTCHRVLSSVEQPSSPLKHRSSLCCVLLLHCAGDEHQSISDTRILWGVHCSLLLHKIFAERQKGDFCFSQQIFFFFWECVRVSARVCEWKHGHL